MGWGVFFLIIGIAVFFVGKSIGAGIALGSVGIVLITLGNRRFKLEKPQEKTPYEFKLNTEMWSLRSSKQRLAFVVFVVFSIACFLMVYLNPTVVFAEDVLIIFGIVIVLMIAYFLHTPEHD